MNDSRDAAHWRGIWRWSIAPTAAKDHPFVVGRSGAMQHGATDLDKQAGFLPGTVDMQVPDLQSCADQA